MKLQSKISIDRYLGKFLIILLNPFARLAGRLLQRDHSLKVNGAILVIKMLGGGSLIMAMPSLLGIRNAYPNVKMRLFTTAAVRPFAETMGIFDDILVLDDSSIKSMVVSGLRCLKTCFSNDTVIDLEVYSHLSTVFSLLTCARNRIGFFFEERGFRQRLHTHRIFFHPGSPLYLHYDRIAEMVNATVALPELCKEKILSALGLEEKTFRHDRVVIGCGCSDLSGERKLTPQQWAENVFSTSGGKNRDVVFLGAKSDYAEAEKIKAALAALGQQAWSGKLENLSGTLPLKDSLRLLATSQEFWGIESSLLQYARLLGLTCKAFLGPTHPMRLRPVSDLKEDIYYRKTLCSPCIHLVSVPPCHGNNLCMKWLFDAPHTDNKDERWIPVVTD